MGSMVDAVEPLLPLRIDEATFEDPILTLAGAGWALNAVCSWRVRRRRELWFSWSSPDAVDLVWELVGHRVVRVVVTELGDPAFELSRDVSLDIFADTNLDPWVFRSAGRVFVGSVSG
jgi:hypothetical protein